MTPTLRPQPESPTQEVLVGLVERITYHNPENGFCVLRTKVRGHRDVVTVVGHAAANGSTTARTASSSKLAFCAHRPRLRPTASRNGNVRDLSHEQIVPFMPMAYKFFEAAKEGEYEHNLRILAAFFWRVSSSREPLIRRTLQGW